MQPAAPQNSTKINPHQFDICLAANDEIYDPIKLIIFQYLDVRNQYRLAIGNSILRNHRINEVTLDMQACIDIIDMYIEYSDMYIEYSERVEKDEIFLWDTSLLTALKIRINKLKTQFPTISDFDGLRKTIYDIQFECMQFEENIPHFSKPRELVPFFNHFKDLVAIQKNINAFGAINDREMPTHFFKQFVPLNVEIAVRATKYFQTGQPYAKKQDQVEEVLEVIADFYRQEDDVESLYSIAQHLGTGLGSKLADKLLDERVVTFLSWENVTIANEAAHQIRQNNLQSKALDKIVDFLLAQKKIDEALEISNDMHDRIVKNSSLFKIAQAYIENGKIPEAQKLVTKIAEWDRQPILMMMTDVLLKNGNIAEAKNCLRFLKLEDPKDEYYIKYIDFYLARHEGENAEIEANSLSDNYKYEPLKKIMALYLNQGKIDDAKRIANAFSKDFEKHEALESIVAQLIELNKINEAEKFALEIQAVYLKHRALDKISTFYIGEENISLALNLAEHYSPDYGKNELLLKIVRLCLKKDNLEKARTVAELLKHSYYGPHADIAIHYYISQHPIAPETTPKADPIKIEIKPAQADAIPAETPPIQIPAQSVIPVPQILVEPTQEKLVRVTGARESHPNPLETIKETQFAPKEVTIDTVQDTVKKVSFWILVKRIVSFISICFQSIMNYVSEAYAKVCVLLGRIKSSRVSTSKALS